MNRPITRLAIVTAGAVLLAGSFTFAADSPPTEPVPVKVVQPVPVSDTTLAAVWMAAVSGALALGSAGLQAYSARRAAADKMAFDAELIKLRSTNEHWQREVEQCEKRSERMEEEIEDLRRRLLIAESKIEATTKG